MYRCWRLFLPHFKTSNHMSNHLKLFCYSVRYSPQLAHQILWDRLVNTRGGLGHNIPCDLHNEHISNCLKHVIVIMASNLTESSQQRVPRSVSTLDTICRQFCRKPDVRMGTCAHSTRFVVKDVAKVTAVFIRNKWYI